MGFVNPINEAADRRRPRPSSGLAANWCIAFGMLPCVEREAALVDVNPSTKLQKAADLKALTLPFNRSRDQVCTTVRRSYADTADASSLEAFRKLQFIAKLPI